MLAISILNKGKQLQIDCYNYGMKQLSPLLYRTIFIGFTLSLTTCCCVGFFQPKLPHMLFVQTRHSRNTNVDHVVKGSMPLNKTWTEIWKVENRSLTIVQRHWRVHRPHTTHACIHIILKQKIDYIGNLILSCTSN